MSRTFPYNNLVEYQNVIANGSIYYLLNGDKSNLSVDPPTYAYENLIYDGEDVYVPYMSWDIIKDILPLHHWKLTNYTQYDYGIIGDSGLLPFYLIPNISSSNINTPFGAVIVTGSATAANGYKFIDSNHIFIPSSSYIYREVQSNTEAGEFSNFTFTGWVYPVKTTNDVSSPFWRNIIGLYNNGIVKFELDFKYLANNASEWLITYNNNKDIYITNDGSFDETVSYPMYIDSSGKGRWYFICVRFKNCKNTGSFTVGSNTYNDSEQLLYRNWDIFNFLTSSAWNGFTYATMSIGALSPLANRSASFYPCDYRIYDRYLTNREVESIYNGGLGTFHDTYKIGYPTIHEPTYWYKFQESFRLVEYKKYAGAGVYDAVVNDSGHNSDTLRGFTSNAYPPGTNYFGTLHSSSFADNKYAIRNPYLETSPNSRNYYKLMVPNFSMCWWMNLSSLYKELERHTLFESMDQKFQITFTSEDILLEYAGEDTNMHSEKYILKPCDDEWHHYSIVQQLYDNKTTSYTTCSYMMYIDGQIIDTKYDNMTTSSVGFCIGHASGSIITLTGSMADLRIWTNSSLTNEQVQNIYNNGYGLLY